MGERETQLLQQLNAVSADLKRARDILELLSARTEELVELQMHLINEIEGMKES